MSYNVIKVPWCSSYWEPKPFWFHFMYTDRLEGYSKALRVFWVNCCALCGDNRIECVFVRGQREREIYHDKSYECMKLVCTLREYFLLHILSLFFSIFSQWLLWMGVWIEDCGREMNAWELVHWSNERRSWIVNDPIKGPSFEVKALYN